MQEDLDVTVTERNGQRSGPNRGERQGWEQPSSATALPWEENLGCPLK